MNQERVSSSDSSDSDDEISAYKEYTRKYEILQQIVHYELMQAGYLESNRVMDIILTFSRANDDVSLCPGDKVPPRALQTLFKHLNETLQKSDMQIRRCWCEITGKEYYVFLFSLDEPALAMSGYYTEREQKAFLKIVNTILQKQNNLSISRKECFNILNNPESSTGWSETEVEYFLKRMISLKYFTEVENKQKSNASEEGKLEITVGFRTLCDFSSLEQQHRNAFAKCCLCLTTMLNGLCCVKCSAVVHRYCLKTHSAKVKECICCKVSWENEEEAFTVRTRDYTGIKTTTTTTTTEEN